MPDTLLIVIVVGFLVFLALRDVGRQPSEMPIIQITQAPQNQSPGCLTMFAFFVGLGLLAMLITQTVHP